MVNWPPSGVALLFLEQYAVCMSIDDWVRTNKKKIARELLERLGHAANQNPAGIFTAGLPGSGKTEFTTELIEELTTKPLRLDMDELAAMIEGYKPQIADVFRKGASSILNEVYTKTIRQRMDFVFDGTLAHSHALQNVERAVKRGYKVKIYYIHQDPVLAWEFTKDRELVEKRGIKKQGFIEAYNGLYENLRALQSDSLDITLSVVVKGQNNKVIARHENVKDVFKYTGNILSRSGLEHVIID